MSKSNPNRRYVNKLYNMKVIGKGSKGSFFGKIDKIVCFISKAGEKAIHFDEVVNVRVTYATEKCLFCDVIEDET